MNLTGSDLWAGMKCDGPSHSPCVDPTGEGSQYRNRQTLMFQISRPGRESPGTGAVYITRTTESQSNTCSYENHRSVPLEAGASTCRSQIPVLVGLLSGAGAQVHAANLRFSSFRAHRSFIACRALLDVDSVSKGWQRSAEDPETFRNLGFQRTQEDTVRSRGDDSP
jgi:hypothetical protein